jgi:phage terminase large subunit GpA-like protein
MLLDEVANAYELTWADIRAAMEPDPELRLDVWSEQHVVIPKGSATSGPYRLSHTPYARRVLQCLSPVHKCSRVVVMAASQMLKTQTFVNAALGWIDLAPANILALEPTDKLAKRLSSRLAKAIDACGPVRQKVAKPRSRDARNTIDTKEFDGGGLYITTAGAAANLAEIPARYVFCDEVDRMEASVDSEGDPVELAEARATTYEGMCKLYHVSSPTTVASSKIAPLYEMGTQESYHVPCPHCGHLHALEPENFRYDYDTDSDNVDRAWFVCPDCGCEINESDKASMLPDIEMGGQARWVAASKGDGETVSFHINAFYAPIGSITWLRLARQHARAELRRAKGDNSSMQVYINTRLARTYDDTHATTTADALRARAEPYPMRNLPEEKREVAAYISKALSFVRKMQKFLAAPQVSPLIPIRTSSDNTTENPASPLQWTGNAIDLVELIYGINEMGCINNGNMPLKQLAPLLYKIFGVESKDCYRFYIDIKRRKNESRTYFLDRMQEKLNERMLRDEEMERLRK